MIPTKNTMPLLGLDWLEYYNVHDVYHPGVDYGTAGMSDLGNEVVAAKSGFVVYCHETVWNSSGFGKFVIIQHADGNFTRYAHLADITVKDNQEVKEGKLIGHVGNTGTTSAHLHWECFNKACMELQLAHWRKWRFYPSGKSKAWVKQYYLNPWEWIEPKVEGIPDWSEAASTWCKQQEILTTINGRDIKDYELAVVLKRFHDKFIIS